MVEEMVSMISLGFLVLGLTVTTVPASILASRFFHCPPFTGMAIIQSVTIAIGSFPTVDAV